MWIRLEGGLDGFRVWVCLVLRVGVALSVSAVGTIDGGGGLLSVRLLHASLRRELVRDMSRLTGK